MTRHRRIHRALLSVGCAVILGGGAVVLSSQANAATEAPTAPAEVARVARAVRPGRHGDRHERREARTWS